MKQQKQRKELSKEEQKTIDRFWKTPEEMTEKYVNDFLIKYGRKMYRKGYKNGENDGLNWYQKASQAVNNAFRKSIDENGSGE